MDNLGIIIIATGFEKLPKVQQIVQSGHTDSDARVEAQIGFFHLTQIVNLLDVCV